MNLTNPVISIIVPIYNKEKYLPDCIDSILSQTYTNIEIILVNDGSPDNSGNICDEYAIKDTRIKVIHNENQGVTAARKCGVENSNGEYIYFVDSDDTIPRNSLKDLITLAINKQSDITLGTLRRHDSFKKSYLKKYIFTGKINKNDYVEAILRKCCYEGPCAKLFKKDLFFKVDAFNLPREVTNNEDLIMNIILTSQANNIYISNDIEVYNYINRSDSATKNVIGLSYWEMIYNILDSILLEKFNYLEDVNLRNAFTIYKLTNMRAIVATDKNIPQNKLSLLVSEIEKITYLTYQEQVSLLMLKNPAKAVIIRKFYTLIDRLINMFLN